MCIRDSLDIVLLEIKLKNVIKQATAKKQAVIKPKKIMLVAGHGYNDPGAVGNGTNERDFIRKYITPNIAKYLSCLLYTSPSPRDMRRSRMPSSA
ncbi:hypothetical protein JMUB7524_27220 [Staphylococcus aureus]